ncbi:MAG: hypothetical protein KAX38_08475, partial [Candidatus Krumholzibacteria bacterium]|nr:hypothetical protein [Candidatus Krumholzibacteria bacterium]
RVAFFAVSASEHAERLLAFQLLIIRVAEVPGKYPPHLMSRLLIVLPAVHVPISVRFRLFPWKRRMELEKFGTPNSLYKNVKNAVDILLLLSSSIISERSQISRKAILMFVSIVVLKSITCSRI